MKTSMQLKKVNFFSSIRRPETYFRHAQGHQQARAILGSIKITQITYITVY